MAETVKLGIRVPKPLAPEIRRIIYQFMYSRGEKEGKIYNYIQEHSNLTLAELEYGIRRDLKIRRSQEGIQKIADWCELDYKNKKKKTITPPDNQSNPENPAL